MDAHRTTVASHRTPRQARATQNRRSSGAQWHILDIAHRSPLGRFAGAISVVPDLPPTFPGMGRCGHAQGGSGSLSRGPAKSRQTRPIRMFHRRHLRSGEKGGFAVGKTKRGKGTKIMAVADRNGLPVAIHIASASPHEVTLVQDTVEGRFIADTPERLIGDKAYDSDKLDTTLQQQGIELIAPHKANRTRPITQDGRVLRRYVRRWKVERLFAWLQHFRRILSRHEYHAANFLGFVQLGCLVILMRQYF
jgi:transposase